MAEPGMTKYPWKLIGVLFGAGLLAVIALVPYLQELFRRAHGARRIPPIGSLLLPLLVQSAIFLGLSIGVGLLLAGKIGLGAPILSAWLDGKTPIKVRLILFRSILAGLASVLVVLGLVVRVFIPRIPQILAANEYEYPVWKRFLAAFYGGIAEEIYLRLFVMTLLAWLLGKVWRKNGLPAVGALWTANVFAAVIFGLGHLPTAVALGIPINAIVIAYAIVVNGLMGVTFGWLYTKFGIEAAMLAHFCADIVVHVVGPVFVH
jgi:hypothetical protein